MKPAAGGDVVNLPMTPMLEATMAKAEHYARASGDNYVRHAHVAKALGYSVSPFGDSLESILLTPAQSSPAKHRRAYTRRKEKAKGGGRRIKIIRHGHPVDNRPKAKSFKSTAP